MANTLNEIRTFTRSIILENSGSDVYTDTIVDATINIKKDEVLASHRLAFLQKDYLLTGIENATLKADVATTDTEIRIKKDSGFNSSGNIYIDGDVIAYTTIDTSNTEYDELQGVTGIDIPHYNENLVIQLYSLPSDFGADTKLEVNNANYDYKTRTQFWNKSRTFSTIWNSGTQYLLLKDLADEDKIRLSYQEQADDLTVSVDAPFPLNYGKSVLGHLAAGQLLLDAGDPDGQGVTHITIGETNAFNMAKTYNEQFRVDRQSSEFV